MENTEKILALLNDIKNSIGEQHTVVDEGAVGSGLRVQKVRTMDTTSQLTREIISRSVYTSDVIVSRDSDGVVSIVALVSSPDVVDRGNNYGSIVDGVLVQMNAARAKSLANDILSCLENKEYDNEIK